MNNNLGYPTHHLAKTLDIEIDEESIYSGEALKMLSRSPYDGCAFPLVRRVVFLLVTDDGLKEGKRTKTNIVAFVRRIKQMAPNVNDIWVQPMDCIVTFASSPSYEYGEASTLMTSVNLLPYDFRNIVYIECITGDYNQSITVYARQSFIELAHQSSATLESLIIKSEPAINIPSIIRKEDGDFVTYPHLHTLKLNGYSVFDTELTYPVFTGVVPFPSLRHLQILYEYSFGDDVVFRGNAATLESLVLHLSDSAVSVLHQFGLFTPTSHPKLRYVRLGYMGEFIPSIFATIPEAWQFSLDIGRAAPMRNISLYAMHTMWVPALSQLDGLGSIQVLSLESSTLNLWDVIALIKALPMVSDLSFEPPNLGPLPDDVTLDELPEYVISTYAPMGERFRYCHFMTPRTELFPELTKFVLLLALACPNFTLAALLFRKDEEYAVQLKTGIASDMFKPYASRFQCFID
ncbi:hypothetical protein GGH94_005662 [Coemansia aciculifera]|uniref:Uncharacterized protein n=1 Tax=Coemansia aciculifera TaxID=417176 RepID=A0A9W8M2V8_9FUNG|nr:hypothetical protein GGH94_005662 [Coemansia aciculifera]